MSLNIKKQLGDLKLDVNQELPIENVVALFGPSGCGKSSLLRLITGLDTPDSGRLEYKSASGESLIFFDSSSGVNIPVHQRRIGYMFQEDRLFPHLSVLGNLEYAHKRNQVSTEALTFDDVVDALQLSSLLNRKTVQLSGGEKQRVALARTLLTRPRLLLLDEPLSGLDYDRKREVLPFLEQLPTLFKIPIVYVTHDLDEVSRLTKQILVLSEGKRVAFGATASIISSLTSEQLGIEKQEESSLLDGVISKIDEVFMLAHILVQNREFILPTASTAKPGQSISLLIKARDVGISLSKPTDSSIRNSVECVVTEILEEESTPFAQLNLDMNGASLKSRITRASLKELKLALGQKVFALIKSASFEPRFL
ncbi:molybdenum ABC transporter ATP-binding protein [Hirschia litorea]|uniref:Molybdenum ABC transporter ATP-binding protein n=1 Tax=Hirschia litorea TaxID=1199156 RepID=A0ABW2IHE7_9PROT